ncbi:MAG: 50S ribosomal protein L11 methyltransferase [Clostridia bacterium]|nr:50S ribosomal protein L11 methyltransferase [Clostridia bacterium]
MDWTEIKIRINSADTEHASDIANMVVPYGIYIEDYTDLEEMSLEIAHIDLIDEELKSRDRSVAYIHIYVSPEENPFEAVAYLSERYSAVGIDNQIETVSVNESEWADNWKKYFKPIEIGNRLAICPSWEQYDNPQGRVVLNIDPGAAFGTGAHDTTRLCLGVLDRYCGDNKTILDVGSGSGILSISALLLGCSTAVGVDIDPMAVKVAEENAVLNNVQSRVEYVCGDLVEKISGKYDIVCANIVADIIISLCDNVCDFMADNGLFICSGIIDTREADVLEKLSKTGLSVVERFESGGWVALVCKRGEIDA